MKKRYFLGAGILALLLGLSWALPISAQDYLKSVLKEQEQRVKVVEKVKPAVVAVFSRGGKGGGSGVLIDPEGYALTNYHVVRPAGTFMSCGLADGVLYDAVLVGWDKVGDVALIKLFPKEKGKPFPYAEMGNSDLVKAGDWSLAMGNPFLLATDFTPTVTFGLISGIHRYQYPSGTILEYTDCIQIDTSINPGNSGGPLFNMKGELIGINGRGSFDKRGRINSGVGYAISINQIKNFMGHLRAGMDTDHASLGAVVASQGETSTLGRVEVIDILEDSDVFRRGLYLYDEIVSFDGRLITTVNQFKNVMGLYPRGWRLPLEFRRDGERKEILVRLMGIQARTANQPAIKKKLPKIIPSKKAPPPALAKYHKAKSGFVNYYFNEQEKERLLKNFQKVGDFSANKGAWEISGDIRLRYSNTASPLTLEIREEKNANGKLEPVIRMKINAFPYQLKPLAALPPQAYKTPDGSGGFLAALFVYHRMLTEGENGFKECHHGGREPLYPPTKNGRNPDNWNDVKVMTEVLKTSYSAYSTKWFFERAEKPGDQQKLLGLELRTKEGEDPCEVFFDDYRPVNGQLLPHQIYVRYVSPKGELIPYANIRLKQYDLAGAN